MHSEFIIGGNCEWTAIIFDIILTFKLGHTHKVKISGIYIFINIYIYIWHKVNRKFINP